MADADYQVLAQFYEQCLAQFGPTAKGVDWPNEQDVERRFAIMLQMLAHEAQPQQLLDLGCGYGGLVAYLLHSQLMTKIQYTGIDISEKMIRTARMLFPNYEFKVQDILHTPLTAASYDYILMNGLFTEKRELTYQAMLKFTQQMLILAFQAARKGIVFNVMSYHVDWCNLHLFYWAFDDLCAFLVEHLSRHIVIRQDYGLYEYSVYVYKQPIT